MKPYFYGVLTSLIIVFGETVMSRTPGGWFSNWMLLGPLAIMTNIGVYHIIHSTPSLVDAFIIMSVCNAMLRACSAVFVLHQEISAVSWAALGLLFVANIVRNL